MKELNLVSNSIINKTICIDFDGVIAAMTEKIEDFGRPLPGSTDATRKLRELGYRIIIHTARPNSEIDICRLKNYLTANGICFDFINHDPDSPWKCDKPLADLYIDDRALHFSGDWDDVLWQVSERESGGIMDDYYRLIDLCESRKEQVYELDAFLSTETNWLEAPASTRFHLAVQGGLVLHSINVAKTLISLRRTLAPELSLESCVITALFHDAGKAGFPGMPYYIKNQAPRIGAHRYTHYSINKDCVHMDIATRSLMLVSRCVDLTPEEAQAIRYHDGQYIEENRSVAHNETPLTRLLQYADNWSGGVLEKE